MLKGLLAAANADNRIGSGIGGIAIARIDIIVTIAFRTVFIGY